MKKYLFIFIVLFLLAPCAEETLSQKNAASMAESYLDYSSFSKSGLIDQLKYEDFGNEDAAYAVNEVEL